jgi:hypothetical protein
MTQDQDPDIDSEERKDDVAYHPASNADVEAAQCRSAWRVSRSGVWHHPEAD